MPEENKKADEEMADKEKDLSKEIENETEGADQTEAGTATEQTGEAKEDGVKEEAKAFGEEDGLAAEEQAREQKEKKFFKKKKDKKDEKIEELTDRLQRQMAEFDNFRKRTEKEKSGMYAMGARDVVEKILPIADNFERGLTTAPELGNDPFADGMNKIYKQLTSVLNDLGVTSIETVGREFDPNLHNAVMHVDDESAGESVVVEEFQKGYMYKDIVLRHSMVKVAN